MQAIITHAKGQVIHWWSTGAVDYKRFVNKDINTAYCSFSGFYNSTNRSVRYYEHAC